MKKDKKYAYMETLFGPYRINYASFDALTDIDLWNITTLTPEEVMMYTGCKSKQTAEKIIRKAKRDYTYWYSNNNLTEWEEGYYNMAQDFNKLEKKLDIYKKAFDIAVAEVYHWQSLYFKLSKVPVIMKEDAEHLKRVYLGEAKRLKKDEEKKEND